MIENVVIGAVLGCVIISLPVVAGYVYGKVSNVTSDVEGWEDAKAKAMEWRYGNGGDDE